jgi:hypothetical protein
MVMADSRNGYRPNLKEYIGQNAYIQLYDGRSFIGLLSHDKRLWILNTNDGQQIIFRKSDCRKCRKPIDWSKV